MFDQQTRAAIDVYAARLKVEPAVLLAVCEIESAGHVFARVKNRNEPLIRWEGHYFDQRLSGSKREQARRAGLAHPKAGKVRNPRSQTERWELLGRAMRIDQKAALESISIGLGQVMVAHWEKLGFDSPQAMVAKAREGATGQIELMVRYIERFGLVDELQRLDFTAFTRGYNGPGGIKAGYHERMAEAYHRHTGHAPVSQASGMLRMGSKGAKVREVQALLVRAGYSLKIDGDFGTATKKAVMSFQRNHKLAVDGVVGPETMRALSSLKVAPEEQPGTVGPLETPEAKQGAGSIVGGAAVETARQSIEKAIEHTSAVPGLEWLSAILATISAALVIGGLLWTLYGWWKSRRTDEGDIVAAPNEIWEADAFALLNEPI